MKTNEYDVWEESEQDSSAYDMKESARRELAAGVLKQAAQDLRRFRGATTKVEREIFLDAHRWLTINECASPFSFLNVCQFLDLVPEHVREDLIDDASSDAFSYWIRRCGRAARRLRSSVSEFFLNDRNGDAEAGRCSSTKRPLQLEHLYMKTLTEPHPRFLHPERFAVPDHPKLVGQWQPRGRDHFGARAMEAAFDVRAFALGRLLNN